MFCTSKVGPTANPIWGDIFESSFQSSKLEARTSLFTKTWQKRLWALSFELWALKQHSKMSPQVGSAVPAPHSNVLYHSCTHSEGASRGGQPLRQGWVFSKPTCVFSGIQFKTYLIEFVVMETKQIARSNSNVTLTRQTCGQRSGMAAGGKRRAIAFYFPVRICYMFLMSKCRVESDLGLCMISILAKRMPLRSANFWF